MKWFRFYSEVIHDPKVQRLHPALFKHWINLLCLASESEDRGVLPSIEDVAFALRVKPAKAKDILAQLTDGGLLDITPDGRYEHHGWTQRQRESDDVASRVRQHRVTKSTSSERTRDADSTPDERDTNGSASTSRHEENDSSADISRNEDECNVTTALPETLPKRPVDTETEADTDTETEAPGGADAPAREATPPEPIPEIEDVTETELYVVECVQAVPGAAALSPAEIVTELRESIQNRGSPLTDEVVRQQFQRFRNYWSEKRKSQRGKWRGWRNAISNWVGRIQDTESVQPRNGKHEYDPTAIWLEWAEEPDEQDDVWQGHGAVIDVAATEDG